MAKRKTDEKPPTAAKDLEEELDEGLRSSLPASDLVSVTSSLIPGEPKRRVKPVKE